MNVFSCRSLHLVLSLFFLPMVVVYAVTGLLYLAGTDENFTSTVTVHELDGTDLPTKPPSGSWNGAEPRCRRGKCVHSRGITCSAL